MCVAVCSLDGGRHLEVYDLKQAQALSSFRRAVACNMTGSVRYTGARCIPTGCGHLNGSTQAKLLLDYDRL